MSESILRYVVYKLILPRLYCRLKSEYELTLVPSLLSQVEVGTRDRATDTKETIGAIRSRAGGSHEQRALRVRCSQAPEV